MHHLLAKVVSKKIIRARAASLGLLETHDEKWFNRQIREARSIAKDPDRAVRNLHAELFNPLLFIQSMLASGKDLRSHKILAWERDALLQNGLPVPDEMTEALKKHDAHFMKPYSHKEKC